MVSSKEKVLASALELAKQGGWEKVSVRKIANSMGFSTMKIYSDFGSKENLFFEIQKKGYQLLKEAYYDSIRRADDPTSQLENVFMAHVQFALEFPTYYELMFNHKFKKYQTQSIENKQKACQVIFKVITDIGTTDPQTTFIHLFALLEGFIKISNELPEQSNDFINSTIKQIAKNFISGLK
ncbi:MAG: TetR/AcrR family transcriptional regulator [Thermonemataceae bacterium]